MGIPISKKLSILSLVPKEQKFGDFVKVCQVLVAFSEYIKPPIDLHSIFEKSSLKIKLDNLDFWSKYF